MSRRICVSILHDCNRADAVNPSLLFCAFGVFLPFRGYSSAAAGNTLSGGRKKSIPQIITVQIRCVPVLCDSF